MRIKYNSIIVFKKIVHKLFLCCLFLILSCDEANYVLNNPFDPENMDLEAPALFFHPAEINTQLNSSISVQLYGLKLNPSAAAQLDIRYDWGSVRVDSVTAGEFFQSQNSPIQIVENEQGVLDILIYLLPDIEMDQNDGGTWSLATIHLTAISTGNSELLYGKNTKLRDAKNDSAHIKSYGIGLINVE
ncbi:MAG: hypothetical protein HOE47_05795 [Candidatus Marinimicrobia bacterium]|jgi:hypothetical protein|nr:hypothetical protein [Candidatus Neomarinimicrobiota bacterium]